LYIGGDGVAKDYSRAATLESKACDEGDALSCTTLGILYSAGEGVGKDNEKARQLLIKGCSMGDQTGCDQLKNGQTKPGVSPRSRVAPKPSAALIQRALPNQNALPRPSLGCSSGHWISGNIDDGKYIKLDDGSLWEVSGVDTVDSSLWLDLDDIIVCDGKLINTDDKESVEAKRIK
jgi:hypothetical protein